MTDKLNSKNIKCILFDLGNVVFTLDTPATVDYWAQFIETEPENLWKVINLKDDYFAFERGEITDEDLNNSMNRQLKNSGFNTLSLEQFNNGLNLEVTGLIENIDNLLDHYSASYRVCALTNTNAVHFDHLYRHWPETMNRFEAVFASHIVKMRKPEPRIYHRVIEELDLPPAEVLFLDDKEENIDAAVQAGIQAFQVTKRRSAAVILNELLTH